MSNKPRKEITLGEVSFWLLVSVAFLYVVSLILNYVNVPQYIVFILQGVAAAIMIGVVAIVAWKHVAANKQAVWIVLYIVALVIAVVCIVLPIVHFNLQ